MIDEINKYYNCNITNRITNRHNLQYLFKYCKLSRLVMPIKQLRFLPSVL